MRVTVAGYRKPLVIVIGAIILFVCLYWWVSPRIPFVGYDGNIFYLQDYSYHIILTKHFWFAGNGNIYDPDFQLKAISAHMGRPAVVAMPVAITPVALVVWMPFAFIASFNLWLSYSLWLTVSIGLLVLAIWNASACLAPIRSHQVLTVALCGITVCSVVGVFTVIFGQTSFFAAGIVSFLICRVIRFGDGPGNLPMDWTTAILVVLAGLKPTYVVIGFGILLIYGKWRELLASAVAVVLLSVTLTFLLTPGWLRSYVSTLQMYSSGNFPKIYAWSIVPGTMNILRSAVSSLIGDRAATITSAALSGLTVLSIGIFSLIRPRDHVARAPRLVVALITCCLVFSPNSGTYEDLLMIPAFVTVLLTGKTPSVLSLKGVGIAGALFVSLLHNIAPAQHNWLWMFFVLKCLVLTTMIRYAGANQADASSLIHPAD